MTTLATEAVATCVEKQSRAELSERAAGHEHHPDPCRLLGHATPYRRRH